MRVGVIGLGSMGRNHARIVNEIANLVAVCDERLEAMVGMPVGGSTNYIDLLREDIDAIIVATPTSSHYTIAMGVIEAGINVLVEKPLAANIEDAQALVHAARVNDVFLATGHIERFNPAIIALKDRWEQLGVVREISFERIGPRPSRICDTGVAYDLATHDADLLRYLIPIEVDSMLGEAIKEAGSIVSITSVGRLENGIIASFREGWTTPTKSRKVTVWGDRGMFVADLLRQSLTFYANNYTRINWDAMEPFFGVSEGDVTRYKIEKREPLRLELRAFLDTADGQYRNCPTGEDGLEAVRLVELMKAAVQ